MMFSENLYVPAQILDYFYLWLYGETQDYASAV